MLAKDFITKDIPVLKSFDKVEYTLALMDDFKLRHLPVVKDGVYQGILSERELLSDSASGSNIGQPVLFAPSVIENGHLHEVMAVMSRYRLSMLPVVTVDGRYYGAITRENLVEILSEWSDAEGDGSVIILELLPQDYSLTDIARIVESNKAHITNVFSRTDKDTGRLLLTLKIDMEDASPVIRSFERFNYTVLFHFMNKGAVDELLQQHMAELLHYINM